MTKKYYDNPYQTEKWEAEKEVGDKKVLCHSCNNPIHIDHLAGIIMHKGKECWFCDNICCLVEFNNIINSENTETVIQNEKQKEKVFIKTKGKKTEKENAREEVIVKV